MISDIIEGAARVLELHGLDGYNTNAIAERTGVSIGSIYQYFPTKDAITIALIEREALALIDAVERARMEEDWKVGMEMMVGVAVDHQLRRPKLAVLLDSEESRLPVSEFEARVEASIVDAVGILLSRAGEADDNVPIAAGDLVTIVRALLDEAGLQGTSNGAALNIRVRRAVFGYILFDR